MSNPLTRVEKQKNVTSEYGKDVIRWEIYYYENDKRQGYMLKLDDQGRLEHVSDCHIDGERREADACERVYIPGYEDLQKDFFAAKYRAQDSENNRHVKTRESEYKLKDGKIEGLRKDFYLSGAVKRETNYTNGEKDGLEKTFFKEGQVESQIEYKNGAKLGGKVFYQNGVCKAEWSVRSSGEGGGYTVNSRIYYDTGILSEEGFIYVKDVLQDYFGTTENCDMKTFDDKGSPKLFFSYKQGKRAGTWISYEKEKRIETTYDSDGKPQLRISFDLKTNEQLERKELFPDGSVKN